MKKALLFLTVIVSLAVLLGIAASPAEAGRWDRGFSRQYVNRNHYRVYGNGHGHSHYGHNHARFRHRGPGRGSYVLRRRFVNLYDAPYPSSRGVYLDSGNINLYFRY